MPYTRPTIVSGVTRATKAFFDNLLDGIDERVTKAAADAAYVRFVDQNGDPLPPGSVTTIVINTSAGEVDDITVTMPEEA
ncbi:hypothetical protein FDJ33_gp26 [Gordonia phage Brandonk123]|uniref:Uncharacterized protein n=1 Tax=Gordonia phage Brandonk123 TaxID=2079564 RepID=A0A2L0HJI6_9CAUD|nr:hypothetical protein FDJ33_gp26 [Gordonia phage Brandonk123]AUX81863.1 hypothetical protein SEA_BRANDONK123_26 [Gordonia phage Brandonk123]